MVCEQDDGAVIRSVMSRIKHPRAKKEASLQKDHRVLIWEGNKTFRGAPKRKKQAKAKARRALGKTAIRQWQEGDADAASSEVREPKSLRKTGVVSLKRAMQMKKGEPQMRFASFNYSSEQFTR
jgi:hypothetical protein